MSRNWARTSLVVALAAATVAAGGVSATASPVQHPAVVSENPADWTPHLSPGGGVDRPKGYDATQIGNTLYVSGKFQQVQNSARTITYNRSYLMAFDATNGTMRSFAPTIDKDVWAVETDGVSLYAAGTFTRVNGAAHRGIVKLDPVTGAVDPTFRSPFTRGAVFDMQLVNGRLIVAGSFRQRLLALDPSTGANTGYINSSITGNLDLATDPQMVRRISVTNDGTRLVGVGNFTAVDGVNRKRVFMLNLDASGDSLSDWYYTPLDQRCWLWMGGYQDYITDVDFSPDGSYFVLVSTGRGPQVMPGGFGTELCDATARFETDVMAPQVPTWINYTGGDTLQSVIVTGAAVYVQGHSRWLDNFGGFEFATPTAVDRLGGGAIDPDTGLANDWNPGMMNREGGMGFFATDAGLWILRDGLRVHGEYHRGLAFMPMQ